MSCRAGYGSAWYKIAGALVKRILAGRAANSRGQEWRESVLDFRRKNTIFPPAKSS